MKLFPLLFFMKMILNQFDPYIYMCLVIYSEHKDEVIYVLQEKLGVGMADDIKEEDMDRLKKQSDRLNIFLYYVCFNQMKNLNKNQLASLIV